MRIIQFGFVIFLATIMAPHPARAAGSSSVHAILITASNQKGGADPRLAPYEATLRRNLPFESFRYVGEGSAAVAASARATLSLGRSHRLELEGEKSDGRGIRVKVKWFDGGRELMSTTLVLQPGVPAVLGRRGGNEAEVPVVILTAR